MARIRNRKEGFTLIELLVAITAITLALTGFLSLVASSLVSFGEARQKFIASKIAQEGIELTVNKRDNNILCLQAGVCPASVNKWHDNLLHGGGAARWEVDSTKPEELLPAGKFQPFVPGNPREICHEASAPHAGKFTQCTGGDTPIPGNYVREVRIDPNPDDCSRIKLKSVVSWQGRLSIKSLVLEEILFGLPAC